jgi:hypothetical protein
MSLDEINTFVRAHPDALDAAGLSAMDWLIIDQKGVETSTAVVCEQYYDFGEESEKDSRTSEYRGCRIPYEEAWLMIKNLHVGVADWDGFVDEDAGMQKDGSWKWKSLDPSTQEIERPTEVLPSDREIAWKKLKDGGHVD